MSYTGAVPDTEPGRAWLLNALCARKDMAPYRDLFFPHPGEKAKANAAKRICAACPVRQACLDDALAQEGGRGHESRFGVRGGLGPRGRRRRYDQLRQRKAVA
jgi:WhiB family redox-sensing transcriptional regulator